MRSVALCLHGCRQDRHVFVDKIHSLLHLKSTKQQSPASEISSSLWVSASGVECVFLDAPFTLAKEEGDEVCMRTWCESSDDVGKTTTTRHLGGADASAMIPAEFQTSVEVVLSTLGRLCAPRGTSVRLLGYSEGCVVATYVGMLLSAFPDKYPIHLEGMVLISPPLITLSDYMSFIMTPTWALVGESDDIVPAETSKELLSAVFTDFTLHTHSGGHSVPTGCLEVRTSLSAFLSPNAPPSAVPEVRRHHDAPKPSHSPMAPMSPESVEQLLTECECVASVTCTDCTRENGAVISMFGKGDADAFAVAVRDADSVAIQRMVSQSGGVVVVGPSPQGKAAVVLVPLLSKGTVREAAGDNVPPSRLKLLAEAGEHVVIGVTVPVPGYPDEMPASSCCFVSGVPVELRRGRSLRAVEADARQLCEEGCGSEMLLQICMAVSDPALRVLELFYRNGTVDGDEDEGDSSHSPPSISPEEARKVAARKLWDEVDSQDQTVREAQIEAAQREVIGALGGAERTRDTNWREPYSGLRSTRGGRWNITIGLVGKPSAGKSSFFNAGTESDAAKVGAFPFTTIEPNVAPALAPIPCPCAIVQVNDDPSPSVTFSCAAEHGCRMDVCISACHRVRQHPVRLKDVAGLVKGAYAGRGKGNQFLNDLCDADVLIHIVDGVGATDAEGRSCPVGEGDPLADVDWVRNEIHSWIFDNACAHWQEIRKRPRNLPSKFSGYGASAAMMRKVLEVVGVSTPEAMDSEIPLWTPANLHVFVAAFVAIRFPMIVAVNKADVDPDIAVRTALGVVRRNPLDLVCVLSAKHEHHVGRMSDECTAFRSALQGKLGEEGGAASKDVFVGVQGALFAGCMAANPLALFLEDNLDAYFASQPQPSGPSRPLGKTPEEKATTCCARCFLVRRKTTVDAAKTSVFGFPANRKVVRCEVLKIHNLYFHDACSSQLAAATNTRRSTAPPPTATRRGLHTDATPAVHSKLTEFDNSCLLRLLTNAKASGAR